MNTIKRNYPKFIGDPVYPDVDFSTKEELEAIDWVKETMEQSDFVQFKVLTDSAPYALYAENSIGLELIGYFKNQEGIDYEEI